MTYLLNRDFAQEVNAGRVPGSEFRKVLGISRLTASGTRETIWTKGGIFSPPPTAQTLNLKSTDAADTAAGTGARTVRLRGVDATFAEIAETVTLNGTTDVPTVNSYLGLNDYRVLTAGSGKSNAGILTALQTPSGLSLGQMEILTGNMTNAIFTVPLGKKAYVWPMTSRLTTKTSAAVEIVFFIDLPDPLGVKTLFDVEVLSTNATSAFQNRPSARPPLVAGTVLTAEHEPDTNNTASSVTVEILLEDVP